MQSLQPPSHHLGSTLPPGGLCVLVILIAVSFGGPAAAHVTLEQQQAPVGAPYKAVFLVPHGCRGSATVRLQVEIPEGVIAVKPMAKPEWRIDVTRGAYDRPYSYLHGAKFTEGVKTVTWTGRLPDALYDEFVLTTFLSGDLPGGHMLYFPAVQDCETGSHRWVAVPSAHPADSDRAEPAPGVMLISNQPSTLK